MAKWVSCTEALLDDEDPKPPREDEFFHSESGWPVFLQGLVRGAERRGDRHRRQIGGGRQSSRQRHPQPRGAPRRSPRRCVQVLCRLPHPHRRRSRRAAGPEETELAPSRRGQHHRRHRQPRRRPAAQRPPHRSPGLRSALVHRPDPAARARRTRRHPQLPDVPATVTDALFGAVAARDQGCRWPGCHKKPIHCDVHHVHFQEHGGLNSPCNCCLMCKYHHHRAAHDPKIRIVMEPDGTLHITYADGTTETTKPPIRQPGLAVELMSVAATTQACDRNRSSTSLYTAVCSAYGEWPAPSISTNVEPPTAAAVARISHGNVSSSSVPTMKSVGTAKSR